MKKAKKIVYTDAPADVEESLDYILEHDVQPISLEELIARSKKKRVTLNIDSYVVDEFRDIANKHNAKYQTLMNEALRDSLRGYTKKRLPASK